MKCVYDNKKKVNIGIKHKKTHQKAGLN